MQLLSLLTGAVAMSSAVASQQQSLLEGPMTCTKVCGSVRQILPGCQGNVDMCPAKVVCSQSCTADEYAAKGCQETDATMQENTNCSSESVTTDAPLEMNTTPSPTPQQSSDSQPTVQPTTHSPTNAAPFSATSLMLTALALFFSVR